MRGYNDLGYFKDLDFLESLNCYTHLVKDLENELTVEKLLMILSAAFEQDGNGLKSENSDTNEVDSVVEEFF